MAPKTISTVHGNRLLSGLSGEDRALLDPHLSRVQLRLRDEVERPNRPIKSVFFPESGIISVVASGAHQKQIEIGIIGREGMTGLMIVLGNDRSPYKTYAQVAGSAQRIGADELRSAMQDSRTLALVLMRYVQAFMIQTAQTAVSNGSAKLEERLARWLLMAHDRLDGDELPLIHDFLALMLGVRRPGVTVALHSLERQGLIRPNRGSITLLDRKGLEQLANASYGVPEVEYDRRMQEN
jgi:CRP-like cAMP-binding protein